MPVRLAPWAREKVSGMQAHALSHRHEASETESESENESEIERERETDHRQTGANTEAGNSPQRALKKYIRNQTLRKSILRELFW